MKKHNKLSKISKISKIIAIIWAVLFIGSFGLYVSKTYAIGPNIFLNWINKPAPIISINSAYPGSSSTRQVSVTNNTAQAQNIGIRIQNLAQDTDLANYVVLTVKNNGLPVLIDTLGHLNSNTTETYLTEIVANTTKDLDLETSMDSSAGNEMQNKTISFDTTFGFIDQGDRGVAPLGTGGEIAGNQIIEGQGTETGDKNIEGQQTENGTQAGVRIAGYWYWIISGLIFLLLLLSAWLLVFRKRKEEEE